MSTRTCLITGGSRGIGLATALRFAKQKCSMMLTARDPAALQAAQEQVIRAGGTCAVLPGDIGREEFAAEVVLATIAKFGDLDVLVNNAGVASMASVADMPPGDFERMIDTNIRSIFHLTRAVWPHFRKRGGGTIVNVSSIAATDAFPGFATYGATKAWVSAFTRFVAEEGRAENIRVLAVAPGAVETIMLRSALPDLPGDAVLNPDDVAAAIEALCEPRFRHSTGQTVVVRR